jgi:ferritin
MLSKAILEGINEQIKHEISSGYMYLGMSAYCEGTNLPGMAKWLKVQWEEEIAHAMKLYAYVFDRGGQVTLQAIDKPPARFKSPLEIFRQVVAHEEKVTAMIHRLYEMALKEKDYATQVELQWFIKEQVEEEKNANEIVAQMEMVGESGHAIALMDRQLGMRAKG